MALTGMICGVISWESVHQGVLFCHPQPSILMKPWVRELSISAGTSGSALASQMAEGACTQLGLLLQPLAGNLTSRHVLAMPEGTPPALQRGPTALQPAVTAALNANMFYFA